MTRAPSTRSVQPTPEAAPVATDEELSSLWANHPDWPNSVADAFRACYNLGSQHSAAQLLSLEKELERERLRLAACGVVAMADTPESAAKARDIRPDFWSASLDDVIRQVDALMEARAAQPPAPAPVAVPVAVSERLPGEGDCDAEGMCWLFSKVEIEWRLLNVANPGVPHLKYCFSHWLPAHAIPLPQAGEVEG